MRLAAAEFSGTGVVPVHPQRLLRHHTGALASRSTQVGGTNLIEQVPDCVCCCVSQTSARRAARTDADSKAGSSFLFEARCGCECPFKGGGVHHAVQIQCHLVSLWVKLSGTQKWHIVAPATESLHLVQHVQPGASRRLGL